jgi:hypothetical protein
VTPNRCAHRQWVGSVALALGRLTILPGGSAAQAGVTVLGRAFDGDTDVGVQNVIVTLEGYGSTLTNTEGRFRFRGVAPGGYILRVEGFGYATVSLTVQLNADTSLDLPLEAAPLPIDSIVVEAGSVDLRGRVRDPARDFYLVDAQVLTRGRDPLWTDTQGRYELKDQPEGVPVSVTIRAFGYLPVDTTLVPDDDERYVFELVRDAFAEAMIDTQVRRIADHAGGRLTFGRGTMDRAEVLRYAGSHTVSTMLEFEYPQATLSRIVCTFIDDRQADGAGGALGGEMAAATLGRLVPEEIERVELLQFGGVRSPPLMLQIYTRSFIMEMATKNLPLRTPTITPFGGCL